MTAFVALHPDDQSLYSIFRQKIQDTLLGAPDLTGSQKFGSFKGKNILALMGFLRRICDHGQHLLPDSVQKICDAGEGGRDSLWI